MKGVEKLVQKLELKEKKTLRELILDLKIDGKYFAILVNGRKINDLNEVIEKDTSVIILPKIRGG